MAALSWNRDPMTVMNSLTAVPSDSTTYEIRKVPNGYLILCFEKMREGGTFNHNVGSSFTEAGGMPVAQADWDSGKRK
jgi:hypothetical protein